MYRHYVTLKNMYYRGGDDPTIPEMVSGFVYSDTPDIKTAVQHSYYLQDHLHIEELNHESGRWYLLLERSEWISDDLDKLERKLMQWAKDEGYEDADTIKGLIPSAPLAMA